MAHKAKDVLAAGANAEAAQTAAAQNKEVKRELTVEQKAENTKKHKSRMVGFGVTLLLVGLAAVGAAVALFLTMATYVAAVATAAAGLVTFIAGTAIAAKNKAPSDKKPASAKTKSKAVAKGAADAAEAIPAKPVTPGADAAAAKKDAREVVEETTVRHTKSATMTAK